MMEEQSLISADVLARYAADAAREVKGVAGIGTSGPKRGADVDISGETGTPAVRIGIDLVWGASGAAVGAAVQKRVADYLERMAAVKPVAVDVVVDSVGPPPPTR